MTAHNKRSNKSSLNAANVWDTYWFHPAPLFNLALCRIIIVGFQLYYLISRDYWNTVLARADAVAKFSPLPTFQLLNAPFPWDAPPSFFLAAILILTLTSGFTSLIGFKSRLSLFFFGLSNLYLQTYLYSFGSFHHGEAILIIVLFLFALAPSGGALSWDDFRQRLNQQKNKRQFQAFNILQGASAYARWPLLVTQWLFSLIYLSAAINKVNADGPGLLSAQWMNGYTLQYYLLRDGSQWGSELGVWLGQFHIPAIISSWFAVIFEATFFLVLPFPKLIWLFIPLGFMLHIGIWMAQRAPFFHYLAVYAVFIPWSAVFKRIGNQLKWTQQSAQAELFYNGKLSSFRPILTTLSYFDWFGRIQFRDLQEEGSQLLQQQPSIANEANPDNLYCVEPNGKVKKGFYALRNSMGYSTVLWPLRMVLFLPGVNLLGEKAYRLATANTATN